MHIVTARRRKLNLMRSLEKNEPNLFVRIVKINADVQNVEIECAIGKLVIPAIFKSKTASAIYEKKLTNIL